MTLKELLARAKSLDIKGRHDMTKAQLEVAVADAEMMERNTTVHEDGVVEFNPQGADREAFNADIRSDLETKAKELGVKSPEALNLTDLTTAVYQRMQGKQVSDTAAKIAEDVQPKRRGGGRGNNLNAPWQPKFYYLNKPEYERHRREGRVSMAPMQVQLILRFMAETDVTCPAHAQQGGSITQDAISKRALVTKIEPQVLFAYYRSKMESLGLVFAGYDLDGEDAEEAMDKQAEAEAEAELDEQAEEEDGEE